MTDSLLGNKTHTRVDPHTQTHTHRQTHKQIDRIKKGKKKEQQRRERTEGVTDGRSNTDIWEMDRMGSLHLAVPLGHTQ